MQSKASLLFLTTTVALGIVCFLQWQRTSTQKAETAALQQALKEATSKAEAAQSSVKQIEKSKKYLELEVRQLGEALQRSAMLGATGKTNVEAAAVPAPAAAAPAKNEGMGGYLAKMMENPEMKKMIREQQKAALKMIYGDLYKELNLTEDEKAKFTEALLDNQMKNMEKGTKLFQQDPESTDKEAMAKEFADQKKSADDAMKAILGEDRFNQYEDYNKNLGNKMAVNQLKTQMADSKNPLNDDQAKRLMQVMREESASVSAKEGLGADGQAKAMQDWKSLSSDEEMNKLFARQQEINQHVLEKAPAFLAQEQLDALASFQTNQISLQKMSLQMARQMMGGKSKDAGAPPPPLAAPVK